MTTFLGIDVGTSALKAILIDESGAVRAVAESSYDLLTPAPRHAEQRPDDWWTAAQDAIGRILADHDASEVAAIGLTGQMHGMVLLDDAGRPLRNAILWNDQRTDRECTAMHERVGRDRVIAITGKPVATGFTAPKILWVAEHEPAIFNAAHSLLLPKDYVRFRLSGTHAIDAADASGTSLLDITTRDWSNEIIETLGIPRAWLPEVHEGPDVCAHVSAEAAAATGLIAGTPIVAGAGDQAAGAIGCGIVRPGPLSVALGTSGVVFAATDGPVIDPEGRMHAYCHAVPGACHVMGVMLSAGGSLRWFRDTMANDLVAAATERGVDPYELILDEALAVEPGCEGLSFLPYLTGERCPYDDPHARGAFVGLTLRHNRAALGRAVIEGITFGLRDALDLARGMGIEATTARVSGGGARSTAWRQLMADVFELPICTVNASEGAAFGAAILGAVGAGAWPDVAAACDAIIIESAPATPADSAAYSEARERFRSLYPALHGAVGAG